jgi:hypothetical protein
MILSGSAIQVEEWDLLLCFEEAVHRRSRIGEVRCHVNSDVTGPCRWIASMTCRSAGLQAPSVSACDHRIVTRERVGSLRARCGLCFRFPASLRPVEEMLLERGIVVPYEAVRRSAMKFGRDYVAAFKRKKASRHPGESGQLIPHEAEQGAIREIVALRTQGKPLRAIAEAVAAKGHRLIHEGVAGVLRAAGI